jgi:hypothetical protein
VDWAAGAEVDQLGQSLLADHDVLGLEVAVADEVGGEPAHCRHYPLEEEEFLGEGEGLALGVEHFAEVVGVVVHEDGGGVLALLDLVLPVVRGDVLAAAVPDVVDEVQLVLEALLRLLPLRVLHLLLHQLQLLRHLLHHGVSQRGFELSGGVEDV